MKKVPRVSFSFWLKEDIFDCVNLILFVAEANVQPVTNEKSVNLDLRYPRKMSDVQDIQKKLNDILDSKESSKPIVEDVDEEIETLPMLPDPIKAEENMFQSKKMFPKKKNDKYLRFFFLFRIFENTEECRSYHQRSFW